MISSDLDEVHPKLVLEVKASIISLQFWIFGGIFAIFIDILLLGGEFFN
jgi:hypothetical protein